MCLELHFRDPWESWTYIENISSDSGFLQFGLRFTSPLNTIQDFVRVSHQIFGYFLTMDWRPPPLRDKFGSCEFVSLRISMEFGLISQFTCIRLPNQRSWNWLSGLLPLEYNGTFSPTIKIAYPSFLINSCLSVMRFQLNSHFKL